LIGEKLGQARPKDTLVNSIWVPLIRGVAALQRGHAADAVDFLKPALRCDFAWSAAGYPSYIRGLAYLGQRDGQNALAEFNKILSHRYLYAIEAHYALSQLGAARASALIGDTALSRQHYEEFLESWKNPEADLPQLAEAKKELAALR
jgi:hypothetical protein